jgi:hypothetical protein
MGGAVTKQLWRVRESSPDFREIDRDGPLLGAKRTRELMGKSSKGQHVLLGLGRSSWLIELSKPNMQLS